MSQISGTNIVITVRTDGTDEAQSDIRGIGGAARETSSALDILRDTLASVVGASTLESVVSLLDTYQSLENRLAFVVIRIVNDSRAPFGAC